MMMRGTHRSIHRLLVVSRATALSALLWLASCAREPTRTPEARVWVVEAPASELPLTVTGQVGHRRVKTVKAPVSDLRLAWMASEGSLVEAGEVVARFDTELLDLWLQSNREELAILERRNRAARLSNERSLYELRARLLDSEADQKAVALAYEHSKVVDVSERGILERELELAQESLVDAREKLEAVQAIQSLGGAAAAEVRDAMAEYERALANVRIPEANLTVFDDLDGRRTRMQLDQDLARLGLALGTESQHGSLRSQLARLIAQQEQDIQWVVLEETRLNEEAGEVREVIDDAEHRTEQGGVIDPQGGRHPVPLVEGTELGSREIVNVIAPEDARIQVRIPEALREVVRVRDGKGYRIQIRVPSLGPEWYDGSLDSVSVVKQEQPGQEPAYQGTVLLDQPPAGLHLGAGVECRIRVPVPDATVVIPAWWATREFRPVVRMASGENRRVHAQRVGDQLLISDGLEIGDVILPPATGQDRGLVLYAIVDIPERDEITIGRTRPWEWEVVELVDDGSEVEEDQVIARLRKAGERETRENAAELEQLKADATRNLARMIANGRLGTAFMDWQEARINAEVARVAYEVDRQTEDKAEVVQGEVGARLAGIQRRLIETEVERRSAPAYAEIRSGNQRAMDQLEVEVAKLQHDKADISSAAAYHARDWPATWNARQNWRRLGALELTAEQAYKRAQSAHRRELTAAEARYTKQMEHVERLGWEAGQREITSPRAGRVYHNTATYYPIEVGRRLPTVHLFNMPKGLARRFELHLPARLYRDVSVGQDVTFYLPAEGGRRREGQILHVADFFERRDAQPHRRERAKEASAEASEATVRVTVEFECDREDTVPPGMTVVVELDA